MSEANTKHTPGPWTVDDDGEGLFITMDALVGKDESLPVYASPDPEQRLADAYLIAAAPDLLAAVALLDAWAASNNAKKYTVGTPSLNECIEAAQAAIKKARGES